MGHGQPLEATRQVHLAFSFFESVFLEPPCAPSPMFGGPGWAGGRKGSGGPALRAPRTSLNVLLNSQSQSNVLSASTDRIDLGNLGRLSGGKGGELQLGGF